MSPINALKVAVSLLTNDKLLFCKIWLLILCIFHRDIRNI